MEEKLKLLFDFQRFEKNEKVEKFIEKTNQSSRVELSEFDLSMISAAGTDDM